MNAMITDVSISALTAMFFTYVNDLVFLPDTHCVIDNAVNIISGRGKKDGKEIQI